MSDTDKETVRRILEALLARLDEAPSGGQNPDPTLLRGDAGRNSPMIVVLGDVNSKAPDPIVSRSEKNDAQTAAASPVARVYETQQGSHPGLERFSLPQTGSTPAASKACFMEPGRTCVHSGACEMRGY